MIKRRVQVKPYLAGKGNKKEDARAHWRIARKHRRAKTSRLLECADPSHLAYWTRRGDSYYL
jgi:hypothetical protein